jgi:hypothetical protein
MSLSFGFTEKKTYKIRIKAKITGKKKYLAKNLL